MKFSKINLRTRLIVLLVLLGFVSLSSGATVLWYTSQMETLFSHTIEKDLAATQTLEKLLQALIKQKGYVSYYFIDGNPDWLTQLDIYRLEFRGHLEGAERLLRTEKDQRALQKIRLQYEKYLEAKDRVVDLYQKGDREKGLSFHQEVRSHFFELLQQCEAYETENIRRIQAAHEKNCVRASRIRILVLSTMITAVTLISLFALIVFMQILQPIRSLASKAEKYGGSTNTTDEMKTLRRGVRGLIENANQTHTELEKSRARLVQIEKMATVGKLAAGVAHSLRTPMTSIKMRLFSLERNLRVSSEQEEDLEVVTEEIRHMDNIVQNFLQYARPAALRMQKVSPSEIVDFTLQLIKHRLRSSGIELKRIREEPLPEILADPDQLKEVFINIFVNAMEAMAGTGRICIEETVEVAESLGPVTIIRIRDSGPGIPEAIQEKVFEPFFSTKEEGTGLGLSIAVRIIIKHGGLLHLKSGEQEGTEFTIILPCRENSSWDQY